MGKEFSVTDLQIDQRIDNQAFALKEFERKMSRAGKPYYNVNLGDKTGEIRGKVWSENMEKCDSGLGIGQIVLVSGVVQEYNGKPQMIVEKLTACTDMAPDQFLPVTSRDRGEMVGVIDEEINKTQNVHLKVLLDTFWNDPDKRDKYTNFPAAEYVHHGYVGGIVEHVYEMLEMSRPFLKLYPQLDRDLLFVGIFFHDIGKLEELDIVGATIIRTREGKLVAHIGQGLIIMHDLINKIPDFPEDLRIKIYHLILSHQGELEFGSPIKPQMLESFVLSMIDINSAYMNQAVKHIEKAISTGEEFTDYNKRLQTSFYQGDYLETQ